VAVSAKGLPDGRSGMEGMVKRVILVQVLGEKGQQNDPHRRQVCQAVDEDLHRDQELGMVEVDLGQRDNPELERGDVVVVESAHVFPHVRSWTRPMIITG